MDEILKLLINYCSFLYKKYKFKFSDSLVTDFFGGDSYLVLSSDVIDVKFTRERDQIFLDIRSNLKGVKKEWYSIEIIRKVIIDDVNYYSLMDKENSMFLEHNFAKILDLFSEEKVIDTIALLKKEETTRLKKRNAKKKKSLSDSSVSALGADLNLEHKDGQKRGKNSP